MAAHEVRHYWQYKTTTAAARAAAGSGGDAFEEDAQRFAATMMAGWVDDEGGEL